MSTSVVDDDGFAQPYDTPEPISAAGLDIEPDAIVPASEPEIIEPEGDDPGLQAFLAANAEVPAPEPAPAPVAAPTPEPAPAPPVDKGPEVTRYEDGSTMAIEKTSKGWKVTLDPNVAGMNPEVFYGDTKEGLFQNMALGKINATKQLRKIKREARLGSPDSGQPPARAPETPAPASRILTADEIFEVKNQLESDPDLALQTWFQKKYSMSFDDLVRLARQADQTATRAMNELDTEGVARAFTEEYPEYLNAPENYHALLGYLSKQHLGRVMGSNQTDFDAVMNDLVQRGVWTVKNLGDAFETLSEDGLLISAPETRPTVQPAAEPTPAPPAPEPTPAAPAPTNPRIATVRTRPRAGLGIQPTETTPVGPRLTPKPLSDEDLNDMSDEQIDAAFANVRRAAAQGRRR